MIDHAYIERLARRLETLEQALADPASAANQKKFRELVRDHTRHRRIMDKASVVTRLRGDLAQHQALIAAPETDGDLRALAEAERPGLEKSLADAEQELVVALLPPDPNDERNVIIEIRAGTGGEEAALFAADLYRMYVRLVESRGWKTVLIDASPSDIGGYKEIVFSVEGTNVYSALKFESGCHRVQRVPVTEASGRIHTSAATVAVLPEADEVDEIDIPAQDMRVDIFCSSGPGGQGVNTTYSAIRITHLPTGVVAQSQDERSQHRNKERALVVLKARLLDRRRLEEAERTGSTRRSQIGTGDRSEKIRTYNFPQNRFTDHRVNLTIYNLGHIMEGHLDEVIAALQKDALETRIRQEMAGT